MSGGRTGGQDVSPSAVIAVSTAGSGTSATASLPPAMSLWLEVEARPVAGSK
jgi:hypothetical protein